ncbi:glycopeptide antibiotics resistance protein [Paenibacillus taihuensis]|uniref:Glycopeptide antibiotics resistance protein n=1 Tax=Paenibacillus taihuensis TaxID=1156355 RepID=A0A3D9SA87_9BACL|nr:VanZ family protein [Paenibacillus taihuensis]REE87449.1 glycopeptide antibiotics resistance protein [Paenibacillus taihuensis]
MSKRERVETVVLYGVFICYLVVLIKILFLSRISITELFNSHRNVVRTVNLIPFKTISDFIAGGSDNLKRFAFGNVAGNILIFIPVGVYLPLLRVNKRVRGNLLILFIASILVEVIQGGLGIGTADIDDIILNGLGGWIGILVYKSLRFLLRDEKNVRTAVALLSVIIGLPVIYYYLFMIKMRF